MSSPGVSMGRRTGRVGLMGSPYKPLDGLAKGLMIGTTVACLVFAIVMVGFEAFPIVIMGGPVGLGIGFLIAGMGSDLWARMTAVIYSGVFFLLVGVFLTQFGL